jgi:hypothetical protein
LSGGLQAITNSENSSTNPENELHVNGTLNLEPTAAPANPSTGFVIYVDGTDGDLKAKSSTGIITILAAE